MDQEPDPPPITESAMAGFIQHMVNVSCGLDITDPARGADFELTAPVTGQRFRISIAEIPRWSDQMDRELAGITGSPPES